MPLPQLNIPNELTPQAITQIREAVRLLIQQANSQENQQVALAQSLTQQLKAINRPSQQVSANQSIANIIQQTLTGNVTGLIGLLAQGQYTLVPQYTTTPSLSDPAVINGSLYLDNVTSHLWFIDHSTTPISFIDLTLAAMSAMIVVDDRSNRAAASSSNANTLYFETDTSWLYYSDGSNWRYFTGTYYSTRAARLALTISTVDNNAIFYETDYKLYWLVVAGAWVCTTSGTISVNITQVSVAVSTTADQNLMSYSLPAGLVNVIGKTIRLTISGLYNVDTASAITWKLKLGGVTILTWLPQTPAGVKTDLPYRIVIEITTASTGATATVESHGVIFPENKITSGHQPVPQLDLNTAVSSAIDLTAIAVIQLTIAFDTASTSNVGRQRSLIVELLN